MRGKNKRQKIEAGREMAINRWLSNTEIILDGDGEWKATSIRTIMESFIFFYNFSKIFILYSQEPSKIKHHNLF